MSLEGKLEEHWPPSRVTAECGECGEEFLDTNKRPPDTSIAAAVASLITALALSHQDRTGHNDLQVNINSTTPVREIEATITVND